MGAHSAPDSSRLSSQAHVTPTLLESATEPHTSLRTRTLLLTTILTAECLALAYTPHTWLPLQHPAATLIVFVASLLFFGRDRLRSAALADQPLSYRFALLHLLSLVLCATIGVGLARLTPGSPAFLIVISFWSASLLLSATSLACTLFAPRRLARAARRLGLIWILATLCALLTMASRTLVTLAWNAPDSRFGQVLTAATFHGVHSILTLFYTGIVADPAHSLLGTTNFVVEVQGVCSGMEGLSLILVLTLGWLVYARRELRMTRALWLVPISLALMWLLNLVRIAALIAIGDSGHPTLAVTGFHAEAGWILFNVVALSFLVAAQRLPWLRKAPPATPDTLTTNQAAIYLLPFLAIVAASFITQATSSGFEWLYPLRFLAAAAVLWHYRANYRQMDWHFSWLGPACGAVVFALWLALDYKSLGTTTALATTLPTLPTWQRLTWLTTRVLAAVITVPIAEELAFRGYLARRILQPDVDIVPYRTLTLTAILLSSAAFGLMHGKMALAGCASGLLFALAAKLRNRIGEAVSAHVTANLLLALWVLLRGDYALW